MNNSNRLPRSRRLLGILLAATTALLAGAAVAIAAAGDLDPTFGQGGIVTTPFQSDPARAAFGTALALQPDGQKIVAVGWRYRDDPNFTGTSSGIALARYTLDGSLDLTFSDDGVYANNNTAESGQYYDAVVLADNSIWAAGRIDDYPFFDPPGGTLCWIVFGRPVVAHYASDGTLLTQSTALWQNGGQPVLGCPQPLVGYATWYFRAIAVQPDGKVLAAGYRSDDRPAPDFVVVRFTPTGALDTAFGSGGVVTLDMSGGTDYGRAVVLQPDGKIIVGGVSEGTPLVQALSIARLNTDGTLDSTFGTAGKLFVDGAAAYALALQPDGKIVAAGRVNGSEFGVSRFTANGTPDPGFGAIGAASGAGAGWAFGVALQPNGKIVGVGQGINGPYSIVRWNADGTLDDTFGAGGTVATPFVIRSNAFLPYADAAVQPDGKLVALASDGFGFALARYLGDPVGGAPTDIALSATSVPENQPVGTTVGSFSTTDPDSGDSFTYTLVAGTGSTDNAAFTIAAGVLKTAASFNYEAKNSYTIRVRSTDSGGLFFEKQFTISVTNVNEAPDCSGVTATPSTISPTAHGMQLITLSGATDPDGDTLSYHIDGVTQDESVTGVGDKTFPDAALTSAGANSNQVFVRAEASSKDNGRVYRIAYTVSDGNGGSCSSTAGPSGNTTAKVSVPHNKKTSAIDDGNAMSWDSFTGAPVP